jgi:curved DNA-binding protein CbpA
MRALAVLELESDAGFDEVKTAWRRLAKANHPDARPGDDEAAERFRQVQAAWDVLRQAEERRAA